jgi:hypothetical protein
MFEKWIWSEVGLIYSLSFDSPFVFHVAGKGIGIRINDDGVDANHPDLSLNFDVASSCADYLPNAVLFDEENSHGTACAALAAATGNGECSVGIAPDASLSACRLINAAGEFDPSTTVDSLYLYANQENVHVSSNSYGFDACEVFLRRRRLEAACPFLPEATGSPCLETSACSSVEWGGVDLSPECENDIVKYCLRFYENDVPGCSSYLDLFVTCRYSAQLGTEADAMIQGVTTGRGGKGLIYLFAAGNEFTIGEDVNLEGSLNSRFTIT